MTETVEVPEDPAGKGKKKAKVRNVWLSFVGRIVAQIIGAVASVVLGIFILQRYQEPPAAPPVEAPAPAPRPHGEQALAVLPLDNFSRDAADAYFAQGMTEVLISDLAQIKGWRVISRTSTEAYGNSGKSIAQIGAELNVDLIVEGSVTKADDQVRVVVQLIDVKSDEHLWARSYDRSTRDILALQSELAQEIARSVKAAIVPEHEERLAKRAAFDPTVYDLYLRGRHAWNLRTPEGLSGAITLFTEAVEREPNFALAHVGLADAYSMGGAPSSGPLDVRERTVKARASAERAMALAGHMAEAHTAMGGVLFFGDGDAAAAERAFKRAIALNPNYPVAHQWLSILLAERGRDDEARRHAETAVRLDPMEATFHQAAGLVHYYSHRYGDGDPGAAVRVCDEAPGGASANVERLVNCAIAYDRAKDARAARLRDRLLAMRPLPATALVQWHAATGDPDRAFELIGQLRAANNLPRNLAFDPLFEPLRNDERYAKLLR